MPTREPEKNRISKSTGKPRGRPRKRVKVDENLGNSEQKPIYQNAGSICGKLPVPTIIAEIPDVEANSTAGINVLLDGHPRKTSDTIASIATTDSTQTASNPRGSQTRVTRRRCRKESLNLVPGLVGPQQVIVPDPVRGSQREKEVQGGNKLQRPNSNHPCVVICIPQYSNFDPDQYIAFQTSPSPQHTSTLSIERPGFKLALSSPHITRVELPGKGPEIEIPDSQPKIAIVCGEPHLTGYRHHPRETLSPGSRQSDSLSHASVLSRYSQETLDRSIDFTKTEPTSSSLLKPSPSVISDSFHQEEGLKAAQVLNIDREFIYDRQIRFCSQESIRVCDRPGILPLPSSIRDSTIEFPPTAIAENLSQNQEPVPKAKIQAAQNSFIVEEIGLVDILACHSEIQKVVNSQDSQSTVYSSHSSTISVLFQRNENSQPKKDNQFIEAKQKPLFESVKSTEVVIHDKVDSVTPNVLYQRKGGLQSGPIQQHSVRTDTKMSEISQTMPSPPSTSHFSKAETPTLSLREKLKAMRKASTLVTTKPEIDSQQTQPVRETESPSVIPQKIQLPLIEEPSRLEVQHLDVPLPTGPPLAVRISQPDTDSSMYTSQAVPNTQATPIISKTRLDPPRLGEMEFGVSLPMNSRVRDQYVSIIYQYRTAIEKLMVEDEPDTALLGEIKTMIHRVHSVTTHVDLENGSTMMQEQESPEDEAVWAENCSAKFRFLSVFLEKTRQQDNHVAIVARGGQLLDILETFLKGKRVNYSRPDNLSTSDPKSVIGTLQVSLVASGEEGNTALPPPANLVIAFDDSFDAKDIQVSRLRHHMLIVDQLAPVVHLLVLFSAEHIVRCLAKETDAMEKLRNLVSCMTQTRHEVGQLFVEEPGPAATAEEVAAFLEAGGLENQWTLPAIRPIEDIDPLESASQDPDSSVQSEAAQVVEQKSIPPSSVLKRPLDVNQDGTASKRQRMTPAPEVTHVSDSATQGTLTTQSTNALNVSLASAQSLPTTTRATHATREASLLSSLQKAQSNLNDNVAALSTLQYRYESRTNAYHALRREKDDLVAAATAFERKRELQANEIVKLKAGITTLEGELKEIRTSIMSSSVPEVAQLETLRQTNRDLVKENRSYASKLASLTADFEFTRQQYQLASTSAADLASQVASLTAANETLEQRASGEAANLAAINAVRETESWVRRIEFLEAVVREREELLRRKEEEIRERRGRGMQTRGGSLAPKSPRADTSRAGSVEKETKGVRAVGSGLRLG